MNDFRFQSAGTSLWATHDGAGPPLVLLHGGGATHHAVLPAAAPLRPHFNVFTPDLRACGKSWFGGPLSWDLLGDDVAALLDHLGIPRAILGGVSGGGAAALRCAMRHPQRLSALLIFSPAYGGDGVGYSQAQKAAFASMAAIVENAGDRGVEALRPMYARTPQMEAHFDSVVKDLDFASVAATVRFVASGQQPFSSPSELAQVKVPTLVVPGNDAIHPREVADVYARHLPGCTIVETTALDPPGRIAETSRAVLEFCRHHLP